MTHKHIRRFSRILFPLDCDGEKQNVQFKNIHLKEDRNVLEDVP
jgi:hypothetical protein